MASHEQFALTLGSVNKQKNKTLPGWGIRSSLQQPMRLQPGDAEGDRERLWRDDLGLLPMLADDPEAARQWIEDHHILQIEADTCAPSPKLHVNSCASTHALSVPCYMSTGAMQAHLRPRQVAPPPLGGALGACAWLHCTRLCPQTRGRRSSPGCAHPEIPSVRAVEFLGVMGAGFGYKELYRHFLEMVHWWTQVHAKTPQLML